MKKSIAVAVLALSSAVSVQAQELFVNIHSGNVMAQGAGLVLAGQAMYEVGGLTPQLVSRFSRFH